MIKSLMHFVINRGILVTLIQVLLLIFFFAVEDRLYWWVSIIIKSALLWYPSWLPIGLLSTLTLLNYMSTPSVSRFKKKTHQLTNLTGHTLSRYVCFLEYVKPNSRWHSDPTRLNGRAHLHQKQGAYSLHGSHNYQNKVIHLDEDSYQLSQGTHKPEINPTSSLTPTSAGTGSGAFFTTSTKEYPSLSPISMPTVTKTVWVSERWRLLFSLNYAIYIYIYTFLNLYFFFWQSG